MNSNFEYNQEQILLVGLWCCCTSSKDLLLSILRTEIDLDFLYLHSIALRICLGDSADTIFFALPLTFSSACFCIVMCSTVQSCFLYLASWHNIDTSRNVHSAGNHSCPAPNVLYIHVSRIYQPCTTLKMQVPCKYIFCLLVGAKLHKDRKQWEPCQLQTWHSGSSCCCLPKTGQPQGTNSSICPLPVSDWHMDWGFLPSS